MGRPPCGRAAPARARPTPGDPRSIRRLILLFCLGLWQAAAVPNLWWEPPTLSDQPNSPTGLSSGPPTPLLVPQRLDRVEPGGLDRGPQAEREPHPHRGAESDQHPGGLQEGGERRERVDQE